MSKLSVLLWKLYHTRKRNSTKLLMEIFIPIVLFLLLFMTRKEFFCNNRHLQPLEFVNSTENDQLNGYQKIFYSPNNSKFYDSVMEKVISKLGLVQNAVNGYLNEDELLAAKQNEMAREKNSLGVIFKGENIHNPTSLNYSIRSSEGFKTDITKSDSCFDDFHQNCDTEYRLFCSTQIAIDTSFIETKTGKKLTKKVITENFPHQRHIKDKILSIKYNLIIPLTIAISFYFCILFIIERIFTEKSKGIKELMKITGIDLKYLWIVNYIEAIITNVIITVVLVILLKTGPCALLPKTDYFILGLTIFAYANYAILFSFVICTIFSNVALASLLVLFIWIYSIILMDFKSEVNNQITFSDFLMPNIPLFWIFEIIKVHELEHDGMQLWNLMITNNQYPYMNYGEAYLVIVFNTLLFIPIILYVDQINPGQYGLPKPYAFVFELFRRSFCYDLTSHPNEPKEINFFQDQEVSIKINNITKTILTENFFRGKVLNNVSFDVAKKAITVLLGPNGAGKTMLLSIITGMYPTTSGDVIINDLSVKDDMDRIRKCLSFCPQHSITIPNLTVKEHVVLFSMMKGLDYSEAFKDCTKILRLLKLNDKCDEFCQNLTGGGQRLLQLAIALAGNPSILILDEPTSGLDPQSKRQMWDVLLALRKNCTILLTTHNMEEANVLADRIAILDGGQLFCHGTPAYLKSEICPYYKLKIMKKPGAVRWLISNRIENFFPELVFDFENNKIIQYTLRCTESFENLSDLLFSIERSKEHLNIESYELRSASLDDVFLRICDDATERISTDTEENTRVVEGCCKFKRFSTMVALSIKWWKYIIFNYKTLLLHVLLAAFLIYCSKYFTVKMKNKPDNQPINLNLSLYKKQCYVIYSNHATFVQPKNYITSENVTFLNIDSQFNDAFYNNGFINKFRFEDKFIVALSFFKDEYIGLYSLAVHHALPAVVNLITNIMAAEEFSFNENVKFPYITTVNDPIQKEPNLVSTENYKKSTWNNIHWVAFLSIGWTIILAAFILYSNKEKKRNRQLQCIEPYYYWLIKISQDFVISAIFMLCMIKIMNNPFAWISDVYEPLLLLEVLNILSTLAYIYAMSFLTENVLLQFVNFLVIGILSSYISMVAFISDTIRDENLILIGFGRILPMFSFDYALMKISHVSYERMLCKGYKMRCKNGLPNYYTDWNFGILPEIICLISTFFIFMMYIMIVEYKVIGRINELISFRKRVLHQDINMITISNGGSYQSVSVENVSKIYKKIITGETKKALDSVNFKVAKGECFGLIGLNGAGKSMILKLLSGSTAPSKGHISIYGYSHKNRKQYLKLLSYCPQFDPLDEYLTAWKSLSLICELRKVPIQDRDKEIKVMLKLTGLTGCAHLPSKYLSGGNKRKLSLAITLIGINYSEDADSVIIMLDEPMSGVDLRSRIKIRQHMLNLKDSGNTIIMSSESLDECELLCNRVGVLVNGTILCVDQIQDIKMDMESAYTLTIKLKTTYGIANEAPNPEHDLELINLDSLKQRIHENLYCTIKEEYETVLTYHVMDTDLSYASLFAQMKNVQNEFQAIMEGYTISDPTLEDAFLTFINTI